MGSVIKVAGSVAAAALLQAGVAVSPSTALAAPVTFVPCSTPALISAVNAANLAGSGVLRLASFCDYALTSAAGSGRGPDGLPVIHGNIVLAGGRFTRISRPPSAPRFRIIEVQAGAVLGVRNLAISGGEADGTIPGNDTGGGILNSRGNVALIHAWITNNMADSGAGVSNDSGRVLVSHSLIRDNTTRNGGGGGGFYNDGSLLVAKSFVTGNHANTNGGGVYNGQGGRTELSRSVFDDNSAGAGGGGVYNATDGRLVAIHSMIKHNSAAGGGGISNAGIPNRVALIASLVEGNVPNNCVPLNTVAGCFN
ncbi:hypothetical protein GCM10027176_32910 [Actinoallomurus bryophytorum]|uniref:Outer membrane repeat protein n=1 Tax=Actinoallomurus bryophytorum TaxID=1490222 RepID=A0A543BTR6_9ACTN|nr:hypothetical protein [Actinoallomurus bryophytorum]TQL88219.1 hypothetical protein FB559_8838 [Actinoallomurus bryophytorum]